MTEDPIVIVGAGRRRSCSSDDTAEPKSRNATPSPSATRPTVAPQVTLPPTDAQITAGPGTSGSSWLPLVGVLLLVIVGLSLRAVRRASRSR